MSKKTLEIYKSLEKLEQIHKEMEKLQIEDSEEAKVINDLSFRLLQETRALKFWIDSLYKYNGRSTSQLKKSASALNGKKGGRPPKEISNMRRRITELETSIIPDLDHQIVMCDSNEEMIKLKEQRLDAQIELKECEEAVELWKTGFQKS